VEARGCALVTGASRGIGRALALELARRGFDVVAGMREPDAGLAAAAGEAGGRIRSERLDVTAPGGFPMPERLRVLVNNAGVEGEYLPVEEAPLDLWRRIFETNVFGLVEITRRAIPALRAAGGGVVCNVTSSALLAPMPFYAAYRASKAAVAALGESLRAELAPFGIRVVEILPGPVDTDMLAGSARPPEALAFEPYRALAGRAWQGRNAAAAQKVPPEEAARAMADAILDDAGPLRHACDPVGRSLLAGWRRAPDEDWMRGILSAFSGVGGTPPGR